MSGQWEVVGKKNKPLKNVSKEQKKKAVAAALQNSPKVEDVLPVSQIKNLFKSEKIVSNKENNTNNKKPKENGQKKQKKPDNKPPEPPKQKPPKNIESALNGISADEFKSVFENSKTAFPDTPIVWLKELAQFLNQKIPVEVPDPVFKNKPFGYPLSTVPSSLKAIIASAIKAAGKANVQTFFNISLTAMATDMSRGSPALGHKLFLQYVALNDPKSAAANLNNYPALRNSYQNRPPIGLSILWAIGQVGEKDFHLGFKVFNELMLPLIEMKNYSRYIVEYLLHILKRHKDVVVTREEFFLLLDTLLSKKKYPSDVMQQLNKTAAELPAVFDKIKDLKSTIFVEPLLKKLSDADDQHRKVFCELLVNCIIKDKNSYITWSKIYTKNLVASAALLKYISKNWSSLSKQIDRKLLTDTLTTFSNANVELEKKKRKENGLTEAIAAIKKLEKEMTVKKKSSFPFKKFSILLALIIGGLVYYDCKLHGNWNKSRTQQFLHDLGICKYARQAVDSVKEGALAVDKYAQDNYPEYYKKTLEFSQPYLQLTKDIGLITYNQYVNIKEYAVKKYPLVLETVESYAPGFLEQSQNAVNQAVSVSVLYFNRSIDFLKSEVFVGQLSPGNMQRVVAEAFNTTQQKAVEYYYWVYEKIRVTIS